MKDLFEEILPKEEVLDVACETGVFFGCFTGSFGGVLSVFWGCGVVVCGWHGCCCVFVVMSRANSVVWRARDGMGVYGVSCKRSGWMRVDGIVQGDGHERVYYAWFWF